MSGDSPDVAVASLLRPADPRPAQTRKEPKTTTQHVFARNGEGELVHYYWIPADGWQAENLTKYARIGPHYRISRDPVIVNLE